MAINYELLNKGGISLGTNFELLSEKPLDSRLVVPSLDGLQNYIDNAAAYEGMIAYVSSEKKHYEVKVIDGVLSYRPFGLTEAELNDLITNATTAAMEFKGATATLPENPAKGDMYKVAGENIDIKIDGVDAKLGDSIVYDGSQWFLIPSGDDIEDTWRPVDGVNNDATLKFVNGDKTVAAVAADGTIKYNHAAVAAPADVTAEGDEKTRTYITAVETDGFGHITGYKTATENVEDTNTTYEFEGQAEESNVYFQVTASEEGANAEIVYLDTYSKNEANTELAKKVDKVEGYSLVSDTEIARLAEVDNYDDEEVRGLIGDNADAIEELAEYVGTIPTDEKYADITNVISYVNKKAEETLAAAQGGSSETAASVKQQLDNYKSENDTRVKAAEDAIDAVEKDIASITNQGTGLLVQANAYTNQEVNRTYANLSAEIDADVKVVNDALEAYKSSNDTALAGVKATAEAAATKAYTDEELGKKVDKVTGKSLVDDAEITKLAGVSEGANKVEASTNGKIKIDGVDTVVYTHPDKHAISDVTGLQDALNGKVAKEDGKGLSTNDLTDELKGQYDAAYAHSQVAHAPADAQANIIESVKVNGSALTITDKAVDITVPTGALASKDKVGKSDLTAEFAAAIDGKVAAVIAGNASITVGGAAVIPEISVKLDPSADNAIKLNENGLKVEIAAAPEYSIVKAADSGDYAAIYNLTKDGAIVGASINIPKDMVVKSGSVVGDEIVLVLNDEAATEIKIPVGSLIEYVTSGSQTGDMVVVAVDETTHKVTATITDGTINKEKLDITVQSALGQAHTHMNAGVLDGITADKVKAWDEAEQNAKDYADGLADNYAAAEHDHKAADITDFATEVAKVKVNNAIYADEALKATFDGNGDAIATTYARKATTLAGYNIGDAYTKAEVDALLSAAQSWGEF